MEPPPARLHRPPRRHVTGMTGKAFAFATAVNSVTLPLVVWAADTAHIDPPRPLEALAASGIASLVYALAHGGIRGLIHDAWDGWRP